MFSIITFSSVQQAQLFVRRNKLSDTEVAENNGATLKVKTYVQGLLQGENYDVVSIEDLAEEVAKS
jgi:hypothetical protein